MGFVSLAWWRIKSLTAGGPPGRGASPDNPPLSTYATLVSLTVWAGVCIYYALVEEAITTVAHLVAFAVGAGALLLFEALHQIPRDSGNVSVNAGKQGGGTGGAPLPPYEQLRDD